MSKKTRRRPPAPRSPAEQRFRALPLLLVIVLGCAAYANALKNPFVFDDMRAIRLNESVHDLSVDALAYPQRQTPMAGRPISNLSFAINYAVGGLDPLGYHLWNLAMHLLAGLVLLAVLRRLQIPWPLACTLIWVVHPLNSEVVDYVTQRTESMAALWLLTTLYASIRAWDAAAPGRWKVLAVTASLLGIATKESASVTLLLVVLCDRAFHFTSWREAFRVRRAFYASLAAGWLLFALLLLQTPFASATGFDRQVSSWTYLLNQPPLIIHYVRLAVWPSGLLLDYGFPQSLTFGDVWVTVGLLVLAAGTALVALVTRPRVGFWASWFFITLAPASSLVPIPTEVGAERRMYLPLVALIVLGATGVAALVRRAWADGHAPLSVRHAGVAVATAIVLSLGVATLVRNAEYHTERAIWQTVLDRRPNPRAHANLAMALRDAGRVDEAIAHLKIAAADLPESHHLLGSALIDQRRFDEGIAVLRDVVTQRPDYPLILTVRQELGAALLAQHRIQESIEQFEAILRAAPDDPQPRRVLSTTLALAVDRLINEGRYDEAESVARKLVSLQPDDGRAHNDLGAALASQGRFREAAKEFGEAVRLDPSLVRARENLNQAVDALRSSRAAPSRP